MYKCTECGREYRVLPQYCDCGNDSFDVIDDEVQTKQSFNTSVSDIDSDRTFKRIDIASLSIFILCIIFSIVILLFVGNPSKDSANDKKEDAKIAQQAKEEAKKQLANIPSIDEIWVESTPKKAAVPKQTQQDTQQEKTASTFVPDFFKTMTSSFKSSKPVQTSQTVSTVPKTSYTPKPATTKTQQTQPKKTVTKTATNTTKRASQTTVTKPAQSSTTKTVFHPSSTQTNKTTVSKSTATTTTAKTTTASSTPKTVQKTTTAQSSSQTTQVSKPKVNTAAQKQALANYKVALRNKIASNINFGSIVGDGDCIVSFKISQSGQLVSRTFAKQSSNDSLNDAVYSGIMQTPAYNPPPSAYKNETLRFSVKMYGGNFEVDLY